MATAVGVDALAHRHVTLGALPATVANARAFVVLSVATAQHRACSCGQATPPGGSVLGERESEAGGVETERM